MIIDAEARTTEILAGGKDALDNLAESLIRKEILIKADRERIIQGS